MSNIENLRRQIDSVSLMVTTYELSGSTGNLARDLSMASFKQHLGDLRAQLSLAMSLREKEIVEIALDESENPGTISLRLLSRIAGDFGQAVHQAGRFIKHGTFRGPVPADISQTMDLRLADLAAASTHLFITGKTNPDIYGNSLVEDSLRNTFHVLQSESAEQLTDAVAAIGYSATAALKRLLKDVSRDNHSLAITWKTPGDVELSWEGDPDKMLSLAESLEAFSRVEPEEIKIEGKVITVSLRDPLIIEADSGETYSAAASLEAMPSIQETTPGMRRTAVLLKNVVRNKATGREKVTYTLLRLIPL
jgi:hypothetical protein